MRYCWVIFYLGIALLFKLFPIILPWLLSSTFFKAWWISFRLNYQTLLHLLQLLYLLFLLYLPFFHIFWILHRICNNTRIQHHLKNKHLNDNVLFKLLFFINSLKYINRIILRLLMKLLNFVLATLDTGTTKIVIPM